MKEHVGDHDLNLSMVASKMGLGERQFQRKLKQMTGYTPVVYLKEIRMQLARKYLEERSFDQVTKVALAVGFSDTPIFQNCIKSALEFFRKSTF